MTRKDMLLKFKEIQDRNMKTVRDKNKTYGADGDAFQAFKDAVAYGSKIETQPQALWNMMSKHLVTVKRWVDEGTVPNEDEAAEKLGDIAIYMGLLELMWSGYPKGTDLGYLKDHSEHKDYLGFTEPSYASYATIPLCVHCGNVQDGGICGLTGEATVYNRVDGSCGSEGRNFKRITPHMCDGCDHLQGLECAHAYGQRRSAELMRSDKNLCSPDKNWYKPAMGKSLK